MERLDTATDTESLIAPQEVRELVARLSRSSVESKSVEEVDTLEGLSVNTGIPMSKLRKELDSIRGSKRSPLPALCALAACLALIGATYVAWPRPKPEATPASIATTPPDFKTAGLVPLTSVTYGPDSGSLLVDPTFEPSHPLPEGVSISVQTGGVLWGSGDQRAKAIQQRLSKSDAGQIQSLLRELLEYAREKASERGLPLDSTVGGVNTYLGKGFSISISILTYYGSCGSSVHLPPPGTADTEAQRLIKRAAREAVDQLQEQLMQSERSHDFMGPR